MSFQIYTHLTPKGDQPKAIAQLVDGIRRGERFQTLLGVTGSGKTFTIAQVIQQIQKPTLIISHNKTLAAQLYKEFQLLFPKNCVEYFISHYDYYQPEAYIPETDTYIEKDLSINQDIEALRIRAISSLISGRRDVIVVASVSCIYSLGNPEEYRNMMLPLQVGMYLPTEEFLSYLVYAHYERKHTELEPGSFRVRGDRIDVYPLHAEHPIRIVFFDDEIEQIFTFDANTGREIRKMDHFLLYPANLFAIPKTVIEAVIPEIQMELARQVEFFKSQGKYLEAQRLLERTTHDIELMRTLGYCKGIENYSRYLSGRKPGERPYCLLDYFPEDFLVIIDESHMTIPQIRGMYHGDRNRKMQLVEHGFRLPSALDNRPLTFEEFESILPQVIFMSATPGDYELEKCEGIVVEQLVRPTGLIDPEVVVHPTHDQIPHLIGELHHYREMGDRALVITSTKRMAEELAAYLVEAGFRARYLHSELNAIERLNVIIELRTGQIDVVVGVNLLREGLDLPEVALVAILEADKEGFLRSTAALIQMAGRAARHLHGKVILYADKLTEAIKTFLNETQRRRKIQMEYNRRHGITPRPVIRAIPTSLNESSLDGGLAKQLIREVSEHYTIPNIVYEKLNNKHAIQDLMKEVESAMYKAVEEEAYLTAARLRDELLFLQKRLKEIENT